MARAFAAEKISSIAGSKLGSLDKGRRDALTRALRRHGYRGEWLRGPWGRFGSFWKSLNDLTELRAESGVFERWLEVPPWKAAPSNKQMQRTRPAQAMEPRR